MEALAHFCAAVGDEDGTVVVDVDEGTGLVEVEGGEGDAEFGGDDGETTLLPLVGAVEFRHGLPAASVVCLVQDLFVH